MRNPLLDRVIRRGAALPLLALLALAVAGYPQLLGSDGILYSPHSDLIAQHYASLVKQGGLIAGSAGFPFWRSDQFSGYPHFSNPQSFTTHPLYAIYYFVPPSHGVNFVVWLHLLAAGAAFYFAGVLLGMSRAACLFMAVAGLFNFKLILMIYAGLLPLLPSVVLLPLFVALAIALLRAPAAATSVAFGVCAAVGLLAGHFQILYYAATIISMFLLWRLGSHARGGDFRPLLALVKSFGLSAVICLGLVSFKYLPFLLEIGLLSRTDISYEDFLFRDAPTVRHLLTLWSPESLGTPLDDSYPLNELWEDVLYFGLAPLVFALLGIAISPGAGRDGLRGFALSGLAVSLLLAFNTPFQRLMFDYFPGFHLFRIPGRYFHLTALFGILLAGVGFDRLKDWLAGRGLLDGRREVVWIGILVVLMAFEGGRHGQRYLRTVPLEEAFPTTELADFFEHAGRDGRVAPIVRATLNYGWAAHLGLQLVAGYDSYNLTHYQQYMDIMRYGRIAEDRSRVWCDLTAISRPDLLDALNVRYLVAPAAIDLPGDRLELAATLPSHPTFVFYRGMSRATLQVYENLKALPRAYLASRVVVAGDEGEMLREVLAGELGRTAVVIGFDSPAPVSAGSSRVLRQRDGHLEVEVETASGGLMVISEVWHPGWRAAIEGRAEETPVYRTNVGLMSVEVPPGRSRVRLDFRPPGWVLGIAVSAVTLLLVLLFLVRDALRPETAPAGP